jgi:hypothetical protein
MIAEEKQAAQSNSSKRPSDSDRKRALDILAKSLYRELTSQGYDRKHIVGLATNLLDEVTSKGAKRPS